MESIAVPQPRSSTCGRRLRQHRRARPWAWASSRRTREARGATASNMAENGDRSVLDVVVAIMSLKEHARSEVGSGRILLQLDLQLARKAWVSAGITRPRGPMAPECSASPGCQPRDLGVVERLHVLQRHLQLFELHRCVARRKRTAPPRRSCFSLVCKATCFQRAEARACAQSLTKTRAL